MEPSALTKEQIDMYLERIGIDKRKDPNPAYLAELMHAHLTHVPFESLTPFLYHQVPSLDVQDLYEKIVVQRRGGYCYELNGLFRELLAGLGFDCFTVGVCILRRDPQMEHRIVHRGVIVELDGSRFYTDVGFGGPCPVTPILMDEDTGWQISGSRSYRYAERDGYSFIDMNDQGTESYLFRFLTEPLQIEDFDEPNTLAAGGGHFGRDYVVSMLQDDGHVSLSGHLFKEVRNSETFEKTLSDEEIPSYLQKYFGIRLPQ